MLRYVDDFHVTRTQGLTYVLINTKAHSGTKKCRPTTTIRTNATHCGQVWARQVRVKKLERSTSAPGSELDF